MPRSLRLPPCATPGAPRSTAAFSFAPGGDAPCGAAAEYRFAALLDEIDDDPSLRFVLHAGGLKRGGDRLSAFGQQQATNLAWLEAALVCAEIGRALPVVVLMHANPRFDLQPSHPKRALFEAVIEAPRRVTLRFGRPVLLAHGDQHVLVADRPLAGASPPVRNLLRVQTLGEPLAGWARIDVDPGRPGVFDAQRGERPHIGN